MTDTTFAKTDLLTQKIWSAILFKEAMKDIFLTKFMGEGADNIIQLKNDLTKKKGDKITVGLRMRMTEAGQSSQTSIAIETNEEDLVFYDFSVELWIYGHGVRAGGKLDLQRPAFDLRTEMKDALKEWIAEKIEKLLIADLVASPTTEHLIDDSAQSPSLTLSVTEIQKAKRKAELATPKVRPIKVEGGSYYVMLVHPLSAKHLKADSEWKNAQLYANIRGMKNPLFSGALGLIDGVVVHEYSRSNLLATGNVALNLLLGAQAAVLGYSQYPSWLEKLFDYHRIPGVATDMILAHGKSVFGTGAASPKAEDFGTIMLKTDYVSD